MGEGSREWGRGDLIQESKDEERLERGCSIAAVMREGPELMPLVVSTVCKEKKIL